MQFDQSEARSGSPQLFIMVIDLWSLLMSAKKRTGRHKNTRNAATHSWYCCHTFWGLKHWFSTWHGTVAARIWLDVGRLHWQVRRPVSLKPSWFRASSLYRSELGQHSTAQLGTMLARFGMFTLPPLIVPSRTGIVLARFKWHCKCSISV